MKKVLLIIIVLAVAGSSYFVLKTKYIQGDSISMTDGEENTPTITDEDVTELSDNEIKKTRAC